MNKPSRPDLSGAYGDQEEKLGWPGLILVLLYTMTIGWIVALAHFIWLAATSRLSPIGAPIGAPMRAMPLENTIRQQKLRHNH